MDEERITRIIAATGARAISKRACPFFPAGFSSGPCSVGACLYAACGSDAGISRRELRTAVDFCIARLRSLVISRVYAAYYQYDLAFHPALSRHKKAVRGSLIALPFAQGPMPMAAASIDSTDVVEQSTGPGRWPAAAETIGFETCHQSFVRPTRPINCKSVNLLACVDRSGRR
jgi:hypothetical protein